MPEEVHPPRRPQRGAGSSLKSSTDKKKLHADRGLARLFYQGFDLNGVTYCRPHLLIKCNLCREDNVRAQEECDSDRRALGLRRGGDPRLNDRAERWGKEITEAQLVGRLKNDHLRMMYSEEYRRAHPQVFAEEWKKLMAELKSEERKLNDRLLADVAKTFEEGASQCCYWACAKPSVEKLYRCSGCGIAKYCSKEHQAMDWKLEHKTECTKSVPQFFLDTMKEDRQRNLNGDYEEVERKD